MSGLEDMLKAAAERWNDTASDEQEQVEGPTVNVRNDHMREQLRMLETMINAMSAYLRAGNPDAAYVFDELPAHAQAEIIKAANFAIYAQSMLEVHKIESQMRGDGLL